MLRMMLNDHEWSRLVVILKTEKIHFHPKKSHKFIEAVLWRMRTGVPWRDLPAEFGPWSSTYNKFNRWSLKGIWNRLFLLLANDPDFEWIFLDSTVCKAHQHAAGAASSTDESIGTSVGGKTTKIHTLCDSHGLPIKITFTGGNVHDSQPTLTIINDLSAENFIADKAYHSEEIRRELESSRVNAIIPKKSNSKDKDNPGFDKYIYKLRHLVENFFARIKEYRAIATRYDKLIRNYASTVFLAAAFIWSKI